MSRYDVDKFDPAPDPDLICCICQCILDSPVESPCRHVFCKICIETWLNNHHNCPTCRRALRARRLKSVLPLVQNMINRLQMKCDFRENGCLEKIVLEHYEKHIKQCGFEKIKCRFGKCGKEILRMHLEEHENQLCEFREIKCDRQCGLMIPISTFETHNCLEELQKFACESNRLVENLKKKVGEMTELMDSLQKRMADITRELEERRRNTSPSYSSWSSGLSSVSSDDGSDRTNFSLDDFSNEASSNYGDNSRDSNSIFSDSHFAHGLGLNRRSSDSHSDRDLTPTRQDSDVEIVGESHRSPSPITERTPQDFSSPMQNLYPFALSSYQRSETTTIHYSDDDAVFPATANSSVSSRAFPTSPVISGSEHAVHGSVSNISSPSHYSEISLTSFWDTESLHQNDSDSDFSTRSYRFSSFSDSNISTPRNSPNRSQELVSSTTNNTTGTSKFSDLNSGDEQEHLPMETGTSDINNAAQKTSEQPSSVSALRTVQQSELPGSISISNASYPPLTVTINSDSGIGGSPDSLISTDNSVRNSSTKRKFTDSLCGTGSDKTLNNSASSTSIIAKRRRLGGPTTRSSGEGANLSTRTDHELSVNSSIPINQTNQRDRTLRDSVITKSLSAATKSSTDPSQSSSQPTHSNQSSSKPHTVTQQMDDQRAASAENRPCGINLDGYNSDSDDTWQPDSVETHRSDSSEWEDVNTDYHSDESNRSYDVLVPRSTAELLEQYASDDSDDSWTAPDELR